VPLVRKVTFGGGEAVGVGDGVGAGGGGVNRPGPGEGAGARPIDAGPTMPLEP
jgi:hypothetical protein